MKLCSLALGTAMFAVVSPTVEGLTNPCLGVVSLSAQLCNASDVAQQWDFSSMGQLVQRSDNTKCLSVQNYGTADQTPLEIEPCHPDDKTPGHQNQGFVYNSSSMVITATGDAVGSNVDLSNYGKDGPGEKVWLYHATGANNQQWAYDKTTGLLQSQSSRIVPAGDKLCISAAAGRFSTQPWCNSTLSIDERVADMVSRMTLAEKIPNLNTPGAPIQSLGLDKYNWWEEASSGVSNSHQTTKFAFPITTGMSFNRTLWQLTGRQIGHEARALMNAGEAGSTFWAPVINLAREPRWGRNIEVPGEDPYLVGEYAEFFVKGFERAPEDPTHIQVSTFTYVCLIGSRWRVAILHARKT